MKVTMVGNGTGNTTLNATSSGKGFSITSMIYNKEYQLKVGSEAGDNAFQVTGDDVTIENVIGGVREFQFRVQALGSATQHFQIMMLMVLRFGSAVLHLQQLKFTIIMFKWNSDHGIKSSEDDVIIKSNVIRNNTNHGIYLDGAADAIVKENTIKDNSNGIEINNNAPRTIIENNIITDSDSCGIKVNGELQVTVFSII